MADKVEELRTVNAASNPVRTHELKEWAADEIGRLRKENKQAYKNGMQQAKQDRKDQDARNTATLKKIWEDQDKRND